jgi:hypothetical protein
MTLKERWALLNNMAGSILGFAFLFAVLAGVILWLTGVPPSILRMNNGDEGGALNQAVLIYCILGATLGGTLGVFVGKGAAARRFAKKD